MTRGPVWPRQLLAGVTFEEVQRFEAALDAAKSALRHRPPADDESWRDRAQTDIDTAERRGEALKLEAAWSALKSGEREMTRSFTAPELVADARVVRREAIEKLSDWRLKSVVDLLPLKLIDHLDPTVGITSVERRGPLDGGTPAADPKNVVGQIEATPAPDDTPDAADEPTTLDCGALVEILRVRLIDAKSVLDTDADNVYHKFRILRRAVIITSVSYALFLAILCAIVAFEWVPTSLLTDPPEDSPLGGWRLLCTVMVLGVLGALISSATELRRSDGSSRIPDLRVRYALLGMRPVVGAAGAVVVVVILQSAFGDTVTLQSRAIFAVAIAAGFTERLVTRTVSAAADAIGG